ncbi:MAG: hypothetical protein R3301_12335 [Saprospiraceae bacterium]|nr:hypothetical protein [Saprospiraceae bacterium]
MQQHYDQYTPADQAVWKTLFDRQVDNLRHKACTDFLACLQKLDGVLDGRAIPNFDDLNDRLHAHVGWQVEVVPGHIPVNDFFSLLARRRFPSSTWLRSMEQLDYLEEPDMFHDIFGHIPLFMDGSYAEFMYAFGKLGVQWKDNPAAIAALRSLYWFTIEFGLVVEERGRRIYGAGILSSYGESKQVFDMTTVVHPFDLGRILGTEFRTDIMQNAYFEAESMQQFLGCLPLVQDQLRETQRRSRGSQSGR